MTSETRSEDRPARPGLVRQVASYGVIGVASASLDTAVFWLLVQRLGVLPHLANVVGIACGIALSFTLNRIFTFAVTDRTAVRFVTFVAVGVLGMAVSTAIIDVGLRVGVPVMQVKVFSVFVVAALQFILNRTITFRTAR